MDDKNVEVGSFARWYLNPESEDTLFPAKWDLSALPVSTPPREDLTHTPADRRADEHKPVK